MNKKLGIIYGFLLLLLCGCQHNMEDLPGRKEGIPVRFTAKCPQDGTDKRALTDKTGFLPGDVMHVSACFTLDDNSTVIQYATLTLKDDGEWMNETKFPMNWPWNAVSAAFTAYYMKEWNGPISTPGNSTDPVVLDRFEFKEHKFDADPLKAETTVDGYGKAVHLTFNHLCTRLTIEDVDNEDEYWLKYKAYPETETAALKNACRLTLNADNTLAFEFIPEESGKVSAQVSEDGAGNKSVTFHLAPGDYSRFALTRRNGYAYLTISGVNELKDLKGGKAYIVSLEGLQGNIEPDDDNWSDPDEPDPEIPEYDKFDIEAFLKAITACTEDYNCTLQDGTELTLLKKDPFRNEMLLMANVDFGGKPFTSVDLPNTVIFDGGEHCITGVGQPIFNALYGTVKRLDIHPVTTTITATGTTEQWEWGILARTCENGTVSDIHLKSTTVEFTIPDNEEVSFEKTFNVGALIGKVNSGSLNNIMVVGDIRVTVKSEFTRHYETCVGGLVGQCTGSIINVDNLADRNSAIYVTNTCQGTYSRYTGGLVGLLTGIMDGCEVYTVVDASKAVGTWVYTGGIVGSVRTSGESMKTAVNRVTVSGSVTGGNLRVKEVSLLSDNHSSTGGIVAHVQKASVMECICFNSVYVEKVEVNDPEKFHYTIGGVIGSMQEEKDIISNDGDNDFNATLYDGQEGYYAGIFCGGGGKTDDLKGKGNNATGQGKFVGSDK